MINKRRKYKSQFDMMIYYYVQGKLKIKAKKKLIRLMYKH